MAKGRDRLTLMQRRTFLSAVTIGAARLSLPAGVVALSGCTGSAHDDALVGFDGKTMGTRFSVRFSREVEAPEGLRSRVQSVLDQVDTRMSTYNPNSELSRFNQGTGNEWIAVSKDTYTVVSAALRCADFADGAFDPTIGPLVDLWGFGPQPPPSARPKTSDIEERLDRVGWSQIQTDSNKTALSKSRSETRLDLSGIAKGFAVDEVVKALQSMGLDDFLVEVGGEIRTSGYRPQGGAWRVAIEQPVAGAHRALRLVDLKGSAIATSGDYRNFYERDGRRYSHAIDPRTGKPIHHALASVSVIAPSTMEADSLSTALMIMGPDDAMAFALEHEVAAHFVVRTNDGFEERSSREFDAHRMT